MNSKIRNALIGAALAAGVVSGGATIASAQTTVPPTEQTTPESTAPATPDTQQAPNPDQAPPCDREGKGPGGGNREARTQELATALNKTVEEVTAAEQAAHEAVDAQLGEREKPTTPPATDEERAALEAKMQERHDLFEKTFAEKLGVSVEQLTAAKVSAAKVHLDEEVASGKITQEEADERLAQIQSGEKPMRGSHGPGGRGRGPGGPGGPGARSMPAPDAEQAPAN